MVIYGALGYFISPIDVIPGFHPVVGFTDDIGVLAAAVVVAASI
ncbi:MAG: YkvA family protein [Bilophila wadsworthia]